MITHHRVRNKRAQDSPQQGKICAMPLAILNSRALTGIRATPVSVEVHVSGGLARVNIVGLPETEVKESRDRVRAAILNAKFKFPPGRITINLAPANLPKEGGRYDLPIALGILMASGQLPNAAAAEYEFVGELALNGALRSCGGALPMVLSAAADKRMFIMPPKDAEIGALANTTVLAADSLVAVAAHLMGRQALPVAAARRVDIPPAKNLACLSDIRGQVQAKRALKIAAAGGHSVLLLGPPGTGKSMMAARFCGLMPPLNEAEALESAAVRSLGGMSFDPQTWRQRPFRHPHHSASAAALVGGGGKPRPGEISLAHNGVLFLDELPEFERGVLEVLREPLENGFITISRAARQAEFPAAFQLIAAMNPCPCGYQGHPKKNCHCTPAQIARYRSRISGPLLDRIDMHLEVPTPPEEDMFDDSTKGETSAAIRTATENARNFQIARQGVLNARLPAVGVDDFCTPNEAALQFARQVMQRFNLSARAYHRILKIARTIADLAQEEEISAPHLGEAIQYRRPLFETEK